MKERVVLLPWTLIFLLSLCRCSLGPVYSEGLSQIIMRRSTFLHAWRKITMMPKNVVCYSPVPGLVYVIGHDEQKIETRKQRIWERDISMRIFMNVVLSND
jgi:hypothetical protein